MELNKTEKKALSEKLNNYEKEVKCPRCGNNISLHELKSGCVVKCDTEGCIYGNVRGI